MQSNLTYSILIHLTTKPMHDFLLHLGMLLYYLRVHLQPIGYAVVLSVCMAGSEKSQLHGQV